MIFTKDKAFYKELSSLALPMAAGNLITFLITLSDSIMIGRLGDSATSGVYIGGIVQTLLTMFITGIEGGITVGAARSFGKGDKAEAGRIIGIGSALILAFGIAVSAFSFFLPEVTVSLFLKSSAAADGIAYLKILALSFPLYCICGALSSSMRAAEAPRIGMIASLVALVFNVIFNYILIFGKLGFTKMGISGAAIATIIARFAEFLVLTIYVFFIDKKIKLKPACFFKLKKKTSLSFIRYTAPIVGGQLVWIANTFFASYIFGRMGSDAVMAGLAAANTLNSLAYIVMNGLSGATGIIIGKIIGEGKFSKIREYSYTVEIMFIALGILSALMLQAAKVPFVSLYNISPEAKATAKTLINVLSVTVIGTSYQTAALSGLVKCGGDVSFILKNDAIFIFCIVIPFSFAALLSDAPLWLIFFALKSDQILKCIPAAIKINRFKWIKKLPE